MRSDVYSLGILLYELGVGRLPFEVKTLTEAIRCHTKEPPPSPRFLRPDLPVSLEGVILKALQKDPGRRYPDALSMANAIQEALPMKVTAEETGRKTEEGVVSLFTHYQPSLVESVSVSSEPGFPIPPADLAYDRILVMSAEHTIRTVLVKGKTLKIGREEDNDIVLDDMSVSRHHALVEFDGSQYLVTDLKSTNGIYQEGAKFLPGIAEVWSVGKTIRIGDYWLRLERSQRVYQRVVEAKAEPTGISTQVEEAGSQQQVIVRLEAAHLQVDPGKEVVLRATLLQRGAEAESFQLSLLGIPAEWLSEPLPAIQLMPGEGKLVQLVIRPPLSPQSRVGDYPLTLHVASQDRSAEPVSANASLQVNPFYQYQAGLQPETASGEREACYVVRLDNQGNANLTFQLNANDPEDVCQYHFSVQEVQLSPDQHQEVELKVALRQPISPGSARSHSFTVTVTPVEATNQTQSLHGVFQVLAPVVRREEKIPTPVQSAPAIPRPENVQSPWGKTPIWKSESPTEAAASPKASGISNFQFVIAWLFMIAVWAIIPRIINGFFWDTLCGYCILDWFMGNTEGIVKMVLANPQFWASLGIGPLVGLGTGISLRIILPTFSFGQMIKASIVWLFALILPVLIPVILPPFDYGPNPWLLVLLIGAAGGAFGGLVTARLIRTPESPLNSTQILSIILGWAIGLGILHLTSWLVADHGIQVNILMLNAIPVVIGGTWMIYQIYRLQSCFIPLVTPRAA